MRTYLGARNSVRFIRRHAGVAHSSTSRLDLYTFRSSCSRCVVDREEELKLGLLDLSRRPARYCLEASRRAG